MHETQLPDVRLYIDAFTADAGGYVVEGWVLSLSGPLDSVRIVADGAVLGETSQFSPRPDVIAFYEIAGDAHVGFRFRLERIESLGELVIEVRRQGHPDYRPCQVLRNRFGRSAVPAFTLTDSKPGFVVVENFYSDPDAVRAFALSLEFIQDDRFYKGRRTLERPIVDGTKELFERAIGRRVTNWETHEFNGVFQYCVAGDNLVYHFDPQSYAAIVYLSPDAPGETGTSFFRHKKNGLMRSPAEADCARFGKSKDELVQDMFRNNFYDRTPWELLDVVGNVYNRLIIFDAQKVHAASGYHGDTKGNGRLFQIFFFDVE